MNTVDKPRRVFDKPVLSYFLLFIFTIAVVSVFSGIIDTRLLGFIPGYCTTSNIMGSEVSSASGVGSALGALFSVFIFKLWFKKPFKGMLVKDRLREGICMIGIITLAHVCGSIVSIATFGVGNIFVAFLRAFAPGFSEEVAMRGLGVANFMRTAESEKRIPVIFYLSGIFFGLIHLSNAFVGAELLTSIIQAVYAVGIGFLFGAVFLRTGNLWPTIIAHFTIDFVEFIRADLSESGGIMTSIGLGDWITSVVGLAAGILGIYLIRKENRPEIMSVWAERWSKNADAVLEE